jgi:hypothetical protein
VPWCFLLNERVFPFRIPYPDYIFKEHQPVRIVVNYSQGFLHPHLSGSTAGFWPFQVTSAADAGRQKGILAAIVELELHQRIFETDWRILPIS